MNQDELCTAVREFERVIELGEQLRKKGTRLALILSTFSAMWCALKVRMHLGGSDPKGIEDDRQSAVIEGVGSGTMPKSHAVYSAAERLVACAASHDRVEMSRLAAEMGVFALCPLPSEQFARMELVARSVTERAQLIPLIDLSLFAVELGDYGRASKYAAAARAFNPGACELYNLYVVEGLIAMNAGQHHEAIQLLEKSIGACQNDEYASLACGVRGLNLALVEKLLDSGQRVEVLRHLLQCKDVWQSFRPQIDVWISLIESGERPNFQASGMLRAMSEPGYKLLMHYARARSLEEGESSANSNPVAPMSPAEVMARRERLRAEYMRYKDGSANDQRGPSDT